MKHGERVGGLRFSRVLRAEWTRWYALYVLGCLVAAGCGSSHHVESSDAQITGEAGQEDAGTELDAELDADVEADGSRVDEDAAASDAALTQDAALTDTGTTPDAGADAATATLTSISVGPANPTLAIGTSVQLTATGIYSDNTTRALNSDVSWSSSDATVVSVPAATGLAAALKAGQATLSAQVGNIVGSTTVTVSTATLSSIAVTPAAATIASGTTQAFVATGTFSDSTTQDLSATATWASSAAAVATIDAHGLATGVAAGDTTVSATFGGQMASAALKVNNVSLTTLTLSPADSSLAKGTSTQLSVVGTFSDSSTQDLTSQATWSSSDATLASVSSAAGSAGKVSAVAPGSVTITAAFAGQMGSTMVTVTPATLASIAITPAGASFPLGTTEQYTATGTYSDGTTQDLSTSVVWRSSATDVATISNQAGSVGLASAVTAGATSISAALGTVSAAVDATVTPATLQSLTLSPVLQTIAKGNTKQFSATGAYSDGSTKDLTQTVTWGSSSATVASISNAAGSEGLATGLSGGSTTISATQGAVSISTTLTVTSSSLTTITVTPVNPSIAKGTTRAFVATGVYSDNTTQDLTTSVTWSSSVTTVATVSNATGTSGVASGVGTGQTIITAAQGGVAGSTILRVTQATVSSITVTPATPRVAKNSTVQFTATAMFSDGSTQDITAQANWNSSAQNVATINAGGNNRGLATTLTAGQTTIRASRAGIFGTTVLTVTDVSLSSIAVTPASPTLAQGTTLQMHAVATYSDASTQDVSSAVTWSSQTNVVALVSNTTGSKGLVTAVSGGSSQIRAAMAGISGATTVTVNSSPLVSIAVTPASQTIAIGHTQQYTAIGTYQDNSTQDLTTQVTWFSTAPNTAVISNTQGSRGLVSAVAAGNTNIRAFLNGVLGTTPATVQ